MLQALLAVSAKRPPTPVFVPEAGAAAAHASPPSVANPAQSVQMLVTLAAAADNGRQERAREAEEGLDDLERLHAELLAGKATRERLDRLAEWTKRRGRPPERELARLMDEIELRILVELAKQERG